MCLKLRGPPRPPNLNLQNDGWKAILTLPDHLKIDGWKTIVSFCDGATWQVLCLVSFRKGILSNSSDVNSPVFSGKQ